MLLIVVCFLSLLLLHVKRPVIQSGFKLKRRGMFTGGFLRARLLLEGLFNEREKGVAGAFNC